MAININASFKWNIDRNRVNKKKKCFFEDLGSKKHFSNNGNGIYCSRSWGGHSKKLLKPRFRKVDIFHQVQEHIANAYYQNPITVKP